MKSDEFFNNLYVNLTHAPLSLAIQSGVLYYWAGKGSEKQKGQFGMALN